MKRLFLMYLFVVCLLLISGCVTKNGFLNEKTGQVLSVEEFTRLTSEQQAEFIGVKYKELDPKISSSIDTGLNTSNAAIQVFKPLIPEPFATGSVAILGLLTTLWGLIKNKRTTDLLSRIKLGAQITASSIDTIVKPAAEIYKLFGAKQEKESKDTDAIMPDKLILL